MKHITEVVAALIRSGDTFLICQRPAHKARGLLWEFVGGKVETGESREAALARECREELGITVQVGAVCGDILYQYPDVTIHLTLLQAVITDGVPQLLEHQALQWVTPEQANAYTLCPADAALLAELAPERIAVIDTETTWDDLVMSIGVVIADAVAFRQLDARYYVLTPEYLSGGMFSAALFPEMPASPTVCSRETAMTDLCAWLAGHRVQKLFAYNAGFDRGHLPELQKLIWYDIMRLAAYRQTNPAIPGQADCYTTGRLKRGYGVEAMLRLLSGQCSYCETHNALLDAMDELRIMQLLPHRLNAYIPL